MSDKVRLSEKKYKEVFNFLDQNVSKEAAKVFSKCYKEGREIEFLKNWWKRLEEYTLWCDKYKSIEDLTATPGKQLEQIYNKYPDLDSISDARMKNILDNNDVTEEQLKSYYAYRKSQSEDMDKFNKDRYKDKLKEYQQIQRSKDDSYYNSPLANEYAREAYINGKPEMAVMQEVAGKVAGLSDFAPFPISLFGPALRTAQKAAADKDVLTPGTFADFGGAIIPRFAEKPARFVYNYAKSGIERYLPKVGDSKIMKGIEARVNKADAEKSQALAKSDLELMDSIKWGMSQFSDEQILELYNKANNPRLKAQIEEYFRARGKLANAEGVRNTRTAQRSAPTWSILFDNDVAKAKKGVLDAEGAVLCVAADEEPTIALQAGKEVGVPFDVNGKLNGIYKDTPLSILSDYEASKVTPNKTASALYNVMTYGGNKAARSAIGGRLGQWNTFNPEPKDISEQLIQDVITMYSNKWSPMEEPPEYHTNPLIRDAYDMWYNDITHRPFYEAEWRDK